MRLLYNCLQKFLKYNQGSKERNGLAGSIRQGGAGGDYIAILVADLYVVVGGLFGLTDPFGLRPQPNTRFRTGNVGHIHI